MFQYAFGRRLAYESSVPLKLDITSGFKNDPYHRQYALNTFRIREIFANASEIPWSVSANRLTRRFAFLIKRLFPHYRHNIIVEKQHFVYDPNVTIPVARPVYLFGYWQSEKYFKTIEHIIRREFTPKDSAAFEGAPIVKEIAETNSVSIHVRRMYLAKDMKLYGSIKASYYVAGANLMNDIAGALRFFVFSDDTEWCKMHLNLDFPTTIVADYGKFSDVEEIQLMSLCKHHIIPNSSFSWWGAWLNSKPDKIVIAPAQWFNENNRQTPDLLPSNWITI